MGMVAFRMPMAAKINPCPSQKAMATSRMSVNDSLNFPPRILIRFFRFFLPGEPFFVFAPLQRRDPTLSALQGFPAVI
jgi:hypothetical protein